MPHTRWSLHTWTELGFTKIQHKNDSGCLRLDELKCEWWLSRNYNSPWNRMLAKYNNNTIFTIKRTPGTSFEGLDHQVDWHSEEQITFTATLTAYGKRDTTAF